jgi:hypothetical protein
LFFLFIGFCFLYIFANAIFAFCLYLPSRLKPRGFFLLHYPSVSGAADSGADFFRLFPLGRSFFKPSFSQKYSLHHPDTGRT